MWSLSVVFAEEADMFLHIFLHLLTHYTALTTPSWYSTFMQQKPCKIWLHARLASMFYDLVWCLFSDQNQLFISVLVILEKYHVMTAFIFLSPPSTFGPLFSPFFSSSPPVPTFGMLSMFSSGFWEMGVDKLSGAWALWQVMRSVSCSYSPWDLTVFTGPSRDIWIWS